MVCSYCATYDPLTSTRGQVRLDDAVVAQVLQRHEVLGLSDVNKKPVLIAQQRLKINSPTTKRERAEVSVDDAEELLRLWQPERDVADVVVLHVVRALEVFADVPGGGGFESRAGRRLVFIVAFFVDGGERPKTKPETV